MVTNLRHKMTQTTPTEKKERTPNSTYKKLAVQWLNDPDSYRDCASYQVQCWQTPDSYRD